jgi:hypothetical protein
MFEQSSATKPKKFRRNKRWTYYKPKAVLNVDHR